MAYAQWVVITIESEGVALTVKNATLKWGKFYDNPNKDEEVSVDVINKIAIYAGGSAVIASCGRENTSSGTQGSFELYDGPLLLGEYYWNCPWGSKSNESIWTPHVGVFNDNYKIEVTGANLDSGALGNVLIKCSRSM
jgi:hypothetical protein